MHPSSAPSAAEVPLEAEAYTLAFAATSAFASIVISTATAYLSLCGGGVMWRQIGHTYAFAATFAFASIMIALPA